MSRRLVVGSVALLAALAVLAAQLPSVGAGAVLHPARRPVTVPAPPACEDAALAGAGVTLAGWRCRARGGRRATLVYLHGVADNRASGAGVVDRFVRRGFDVVAYDSRAHGGSEGEACTYGFYEKRDLSRVLDVVEPGPVVLLGASLGAAVALQAAAEDERIGAVVAAEIFSDLRAVVRERASFVVPAGLLRRLMDVAEARGRFDADAVSPVLAARKVAVPVLLVHGSADVDTSPEHSRRVFDALGGPKRLILVPEAAHNASLRGDVWSEIETWIDEALAPETPVAAFRPALE